MKTAILLLIASTLTVLAITAKAATIQNNDKNAYQLRIIEKGQEKRIDLQPSLEAIDLCSSKCELYIDDDPDPYDMVAADAFIIEGGQVYDVNETAPGANTPNQ